MVVCDFTGFLEPEMVKRRPVVVIRRHPHHSKLVTVVPLSTTEPMPLRPYHHRMTQHGPKARPGDVCWAKCDMLLTVATHRLDLVRGSRDPVTHERQYFDVSVSADDLAAIMEAVRCHLAL